MFVEHYWSGDNCGPFSLVCFIEVEGQGDGTCWICTHKHPVITRPTFPGNGPRTSSSSLYRPQVYQLSNRVIYGHLSPWRVKVAPYLHELDGAFHIISYVPICFFKWASNLLMHLCTPAYIYKPEEFINWFISDISTLLLGK